MLKKRIIPLLLLHDDRMVKGKQFKNFRDTGNPRTAVRIYSAQDSDELAFLDIQGSLNSRDALVDVLRDASEECFMPLVAGGGVKSVEDVRELLKAGADKVIITTAAVSNPKLIQKSTEKFGNQCIVAGIDYRHESDGTRVWIRSGNEPTRLTPLEHARRLIDLGVGEILLNCINRDGMMQGYDIAVADEIAKASSIPVILCGGAGNFMHLAEAFQKTEVSAVACASLFHFGDNNPIRARSYLRNLGIPMRVLK